MAMFDKKAKSTNTPAAPGDRALEIDASMQGTLSFKDPVNLVINGNFEGDLETVGKLTIGEDASVKARIRGEVIVVHGEIIGDVICTKALELAPTARLIGDVQTPAISMEHGSILQGQVNMISTDTKARTITNKASNMGVDELASYLSVEKSLIFEWADNGKLPGVREGQTWRFDKKKVDEWVASGRIK
jgi:excisionase family DNA binding protein